MLDACALWQNFDGVGKFDVSTNTYTDIVTTSFTSTTQKFDGAVALGTFVYFIPWVRDPPPLADPHRVCSTAARGVRIYVLLLRRI